MKFLRLTVSVGDPAAKKQLPFGSKLVNQIRRWRHKIFTALLNRQPKRSD